MGPESRFLIYLSVLFLSILGGIYKLKYKDKASRILVGLLCLTLVSEFTAYWAAVKFQNNMFVYHFFAPVQLIIIGIYFDNIDCFKRKQKIGLLIGMLGAIIAVVNTVFFQPLKTLNSNFLLFEGLIIMGLALYSFQRILTDEKLDIYKYRHFWMIVILIFFWSVTYTTWSLYSVLGVKKLFLKPYISYVIWTVNIITYSAMGFVLLFFSDKRLANG